MFLIVHVMKELIELRYVNSKYLPVQLNQFMT